MLVNPNSARKHVGNRFEELVEVVFTETGVANKKIVLQIPYETGEGIKTGYFGSICAIHGRSVTLTVRFVPL